MKGRGQVRERAQPPLDRRQWSPSHSDNPCSPSPRSFADLNILPFVRDPDGPFREGPVALPRGEELPLPPGGDSERGFSPGGGSPPRPGAGGPPPPGGRGILPRSRRRDHRHRCRSAARVPRGSPPWSPLPFPLPFTLAITPGIRSHQSIVSVRSSVAGIGPKRRSMMSRSSASGRGPARVQEALDLGVGREAVGVLAVGSRISSASWHSSPSSPVPPRWITTSPASRASGVDPGGRDEALDVVFGRRARSAG